MEQAQSCLDKGSYPEAVAAAAKARAAAGDEVQKRQLMSFNSKLNDAGKAQLENYLKMLQNKEYLPAIKGIFSVSRTFATLPCGKAAAAALDKAASDEATKDIVAKVKAEEAKPAPAGEPATKPAECH